MLADVGVPDDDAMRAAWAAALCAAHGLRADRHAHEIARMLALPEQCWPVCCGNDCRPCADDLAVIVRAALRDRPPAASAG